MENIEKAMQKVEEEIKKMKEMERKDEEQERKQEEKKEKKSQDNDMEEKRWEEWNREIRKKNIIITGINIKEEIKKEMVEEWLKKELGIEIRLIKIWIIKGRRELVEAQCSSREEKEKIMENKNRLKGTKIYIDHDLTFKERRNREIVWKKAREYKDEGMTENKEDKLEYIKRFDIIGLVETWIIKEKEEWIKEKLKDFDIECVEARKDNKKGRAKGGIILGIRRGLMDAQRRLRATEEVIAVEVKKKEKTYRIIVTYMNEKKKENWKEIKKVLEDNERTITIIGGDFNARIGEEEGWLEEEETFNLRSEMEKERNRKSRDKTVNKEGEKMLEEVRNNGLYITNGNMNGDEEGEFTYIGPRGMTTIDYLLTNISGKEIIQHMKIGDKIESDHMRIEVTWKEKTEERRKEIRKEITDWTQEGIRKYQENLKEEEIVRAKNWKELKEIIRKAIPKKTIEEKVRKERWYDKECRQKKRELKNLLKLCKKEGKGQKRFYEARKEYKKLLKEKLEKEGEKIIEEMRRDKTEKKFWEIVNQNRNGREGIDENIRREDWIKHFTKQLGGTEIDIGEEGERTEEVTNEELEKGGSRGADCKITEEITEEEIEVTIRKLKKKKAVGPDGIGNEAWIYGIEKLRGKMKEILNKMWNGGKLTKEWKEEEKKGLSETQLGFRKERGTIDAVYILKNAINESIRREKGKLCVLFADMKGAFDRLKREEIWNMLEKIGIEENITERIRDIYTGTKSTIKIKEKRVRSMELKKGVRQGCPLSPTLFNVSLADLEEEMKKVQEGGVVLGRKKIYSLSYADDVALMSTTPEGLKEMIERLGKYLEKKGLELNTEKSKIMVFRKGQGRRTRLEFKWKEEVIEEVKEFTYLGYIMKGNSSDEGQIKKLEGKAKSVVGRIWSIGERKFKEDWDKRMRLFDALIESVMMYGAEIWGWKERKELERIQRKYIKWVLKLDKNTPDYIVMKETNRDDLIIKIGKRALKYEEKLEKQERNTILGECWKIQERRREEKSQGDKREFLKKRGWSIEKYWENKGRKESVWQRLEEKGREIQTNYKEERIKDSRYAEEIKYSWKNTEGDTWREAKD
ncbi:golgin subfamily A member 6-like protein 22 [Camponotus floridanus]|uniref:golgin subfamily A member 6-like protein 22 n=1 Tax=Camponotus floridanus TaxID=104421 RepID=UPI000DC6C707|nr:golgin subfamily A member 6-like protein 22 [Camponotus floridanus]